MQNYNNEPPKKVYGQVTEKKDGFFTRIFKNLLLDVSPAAVFFFLLWASSWLWCFILFPQEKVN